jgi:CRISPR/Cas system CSM-associated protein Csm3 (group 7 of RAMP superfamily)
MSRQIKSRLRVEGTLVAETPLHVGGYGDSSDTDLPLAQNGKREWYLPGTSIAGVVRNWCEKNLTEPGSVEIIRELFGPRRQPGKEEGHASFVLIEDARVEQVDEQSYEIRDGVGIDRFYATAADRVKFDRAILPRGTKLSFRMTVEVRSQKRAGKAAASEAEQNGEGKEEFENRERKTKAVCAHLIAALTQSKVRFGAAKTRGLGRLKLRNCRIKEENLNDFEAIVKLLKDENIVKPFATWLTEFESSLTREQKEDLRKLKNEGPQISILVHWKPRLPVMVKSGYDGVGVDALPLASAVNEHQLALVLPGSSIKGVLRSHAERIMRTLLQDRYSTRGNSFHDQIDGIPLVEELFGSRCKLENGTNNGSSQANRFGSNPTNVGLGALGADDCYAKEFMDVSRWRKVEAARDEAAHGEGGAEPGEVSYFRRELWKCLREIDERRSDLLEQDRREDTKLFEINHHVAIDRWTGGAAEGALYSVLAPQKMEWEPIRLSLDLMRIPEHSRLPALMLVMLVLRDLAEDRLPIGFGTNRGLGEIGVEGITFDAVSLGEIGFTRNKGNFAEMKQELTSKFPSEAWNEWLRKM